MIVLKEGYYYELEALEGTNSQKLQFIEKTEDYLIQSGTTNEEVLKVLIHRLGFQNKKLPSRQSSLAITKLEEALMWLNKRTEERKLRGVEGTNKQ